MSRCLKTFCEFINLICDDMTKADAFKIIIIGDGFVGKTCLLLAYKTKKPVAAGEYLPTIFDNLSATHPLDGMFFEITLWDTAGQEAYDKLRILAYPNTQCIILCFAIDVEASFKNIRAKWTKEVNDHMPNVPIVLVATKCDMRGVDNPNLHLVSYKDGDMLAKHIKAECYLECSAHTMTGIVEVIDEAVKACLKRKIQASQRPLRRKCSIL